MEARGVPDVLANPVLLSHGERLTDERHQAHRALDLHPAVSHFFRFWLWLTTGMVTKEFVAVHRKHHAKCETEEDPHSPQTRGINKVILIGSDLGMPGTASGRFGWRADCLGDMGGFSKTCLYSSARVFSPSNGWPPVAMR